MLDRRLKPITSERDLSLRLTAYSQSDTKSKAEKLANSKDSNKLRQAAALYVDIYTQAIETGDTAIWAGALDDAADVYFDLATKAITPKEKDECILDAIRCLKQIITASEKGLIPCPSPFWAQRLDHLARFYSELSVNREDKLNRAMECLERMATYIRSCQNSPSFSPDGLRQYLHEVLSRQEEIRAKLAEHGKSGSRSFLAKVIGLCARHRNTIRDPIKDATAILDRCQKHQKISDAECKEVTMLINLAVAEDVSETIRLQLERCLSSVRAQYL